MVCLNLGIINIEIITMINTMKYFEARLTSNVWTSMKYITHREIGRNLNGAFPPLS